MEVEALAADVPWAVILQRMHPDHDEIAVGGQRHAVVDLIAGRVGGHQDRGPLFDLAKSKSWPFPVT